jgi:hypothetical protein
MTLEQVIDKAPAIGVYLPIIFIILFVGFVCVFLGAASVNGDEDYQKGATFFIITVIFSILGTYYSFVYTVREINAEKWERNIVSPFIKNLPITEKKVTHASFLAHREGEKVVMDITYLDKGVKKSFKGIAEIHFDKNLKEKKITYKELKKELPYDNRASFFDVVLYTDDIPDFSTFGKDSSYHVNLILPDSHHTGFGIALIVLNIILFLISVFSSGHCVIQAIRERRRTENLSIALEDDEPSIYAGEIRSLRIELEDDEVINQNNRRIIR